VRVVRARTARQINQRIKTSPCQKESRPPQTVENAIVPFKFALKALNDIALQHESQCHTQIATSLGRAYFMTDRITLGLAPSATTAPYQVKTQSLRT
jgi:hypothetical protein